jgi:copper oxidase (laccase) domain-containing protein
VGDELRAAFGPDASAFFRRGPSGRPHLDVRSANVRQLSEAGLHPESIHHLDECTRCRPDLYHSYRRDGPGAGRMISFVGFRR